jgi:NADP-dependent 3-hydroxy acid dehydrogenase YdfG
VTGPSSGTIGGQTALDLATWSPKELILAGRDISKVQPVIDQIQKENPSVAVSFVKLDLANLDSVRQAAKEINAKVDKLDVLINNAGGMLYTFSAMLSVIIHVNLPCSDGSERLHSNEGRNRASVWCQPRRSLSLDESAGF